MLSIQINYFVVFMKEEFGDSIQQNIPFNRPFIAGKELFYISQAVLGGHLAGDGRFTKLCNRWMEDKFGARDVMLTNSCTAPIGLVKLIDIF